MKLLFDENVSPRLVAALINEYPDSAHVRDVGLRGAADARIWGYAQAHGRAIMSKDADFRERSFLEGAPPKVVWLDVGSATTAVIIESLEREQPRLLVFEAQPESSVLILSIGPGAV